MKLKEDMKEKYNYEKEQAQGDAYNARIFSYAEDWANLMEARMEKGEELEAIANETSREADYDGITGYMYSWAAKILAMAWEHGEKLRVWFNLENQISNEGEVANKNGQILNTAILNMAVVRDEDKTDDES